MRLHELLLDVTPEGGKRNTVPEGGKRNTVPEGGKRNTVPEGGKRSTSLQQPPLQDPEVTGIRIDSRRVEAGDLFVATAGEHFDGRDFAAEAARRGAVAVLGQGRAPAELAVPWVAVEEPRRWIGPLAARLYGYPHQRLKLIGVTGTNGKSTVTALLARMLEAAGHPCGILGTLGYHFGKLAYTAARTTPEACDVFRTLEEMRSGGARAAVMEVSSHALVLHRVAGARYDLALFTNLTRDHFDFHGDVESYYAAKRSLFDQLKPGGRAVVGIADDYGRRLASELKVAPKGSKCDVARLTFGPGGDVEAKDATLTLDGIRGSISTPRGEVPFTSRLIGRYNLENLVAAAAAAEALGLDHEAVTAGISRQPTLSGRLESMDCGQPYPVLIDYAHTPGALEAALRSVAELTDRRIALVFGCGGDRDRGKRPIMGRIAGELAALPVVTSDNPRGEDPQAILRAVEEGLKESGNRHYRMMPDRREAIRRAIAVAGAGDDWLVMVAGKGHEAFQLAAGKRTAFSDREELHKAIRETGGGPAGSSDRALGECRG